MPNLNLHNPRIWLLLALIPFVFPVNAYSQSRSRPKPARGERVTITPRTVVILRRGDLVKNFPGKRRATIKYPVITGLRDANVLRRVRSILEIKNVFDTSIAEYREDNWLEELGYDVNFNDRSILDITFTQSGSGAYPDTQTKHFAINLKNGTVIRAADAFESSEMNALYEAVKAKFNVALDQNLASLRDSKSDPEDIRIAREAQEALEFKLSDIDDFSITENGVTFLYDAGYPHVIQALEPDGRYFFTYAELKPFIKRDGPLGQFIR